MEPQFQLRIVYYFEKAINRILFTVYNTNHIITLNQSQKLNPNLQDTRNIIILIYKILEIY